MSTRTRGVAALTGCLLLVGLSGCSSDLPEISEADSAACAELTAALPAEVAGEDLSDDTDRTAAWGGITLTCGVEMPAAYNDFSRCAVIGKVGWFMPPSELRDPESDITITALTYTPRVSVFIPAGYRGSDEIQLAVSEAIAKTLTAGDPCL